LEKTEFLNKTQMKRILLLCFLVILMFVAIENFGVVLALLGKFMDVIFPFILGACIAFVFNVPMKKIEQTLFAKKPNFKGKRAISYILSLILVLGIIAIAMFVIIPELIDTVKELAKQAPSAVKSVEAYMISLTDRWPELKAVTKNIDFDYDQLISKLGTILTGATGLLSSTVGIVTSVVSGFATFVIAFCFSIYLLVRKEEFSVQFKKVLYAILPEKVVKEILKVGNLSNKTFSSFLTGQCLEACILGAMFFVAMSIFRMPYALLISVLIALTALIPIFGAFIGCAVGVVLILMISPKQALIFLIMFFVLQQIEGNLIYPHVVGGSVGLPSIWVLVAITVGGDLMGIAGMIIFIPLCSVFYSLFREFVYKRLDKRNITSDKFEPYEKTTPAPAQEESSADEEVKA